METLRLDADAAGFAKAVEIWARGGLVALPTETVYGLGADARNGAAVAAIYEAKGRPSFNPLIVHVADLAAAQEIVEFDAMAHKLAEAFWPGPMTLVLPIKGGSGISELVSAGLPTLAIRVPAHPVAQSLLQGFNGPVAAPSANRSGGLTPTRADHVLAHLGGRIDAVVDGGACAVGLESTIVMPQNSTVTLLRQGGIPQEEIEAVLGAEINADTVAETPTSPGQLLSHYAPQLPLRINATAPTKAEFYIGFGACDADLNLSEKADLREAAANLFAHLHLADQRATECGKSAIAVAPIPETGLGHAINDRLTRAAAG